MKPALLRCALQDGNDADVNEEEEDVIVAGCAEGDGEDDEDFIIDEEERMDTPRKDGSRRESCFNKCARDLAISLDRRHICPLFRRVSICRSSPAHIFTTSESPTACNMRSCEASGRRATSAAAYEAGRRVPHVAGGVRGIQVKNCFRRCLYLYNGGRLDDKYHFRIEQRQEVVQQRQSSTGQGAPIRENNCTRRNYTAARTYQGVHIQRF
jgi:hypothetical protein